MLDKTEARCLDSRAKSRKYGSAKRKSQQCEHGKERGDYCFPCARLGGDNTYDRLKRTESGHMLPTTAALCALLVLGGWVLVEIWRVL